MMAMGPERSKALHNFSMPCLKWGNQRFLRCVKVTPFDHPSQPHNNNSKRKAIVEDDIDAVREKLMVDLKVAANNLKVSIFEEARPWNLRTRRAACKAPHNREEKRNIDSVAEAVEEKIGERPKFSVSLSKEEVEQDFWALVGTRPPRRPKKRPRILQRQLDTLFPGFWLAEVTAESYKVPDVPE